MARNLVAGIREHLENDDGEVPLRKNGDEVTLLVEYSRREREILLEGGMLRQFRKQKPAEATVSQTESTTAEPGAGDIPGDYPNSEVPRG